MINNNIITMIEPLMPRRKIFFKMEMFVLIHKIEIGKKRQMLIYKRQMLIYKRKLEQ